jgi:hypothetical protein
MGARRLCTAEVRVRFSYGPPSFRSYRIVALPWLCNPVTAVRFCLGAPVLCSRILTVLGTTQYLRGNRSDCSSFLGVVKWHHPWFGTM